MELIKVCNEIVVARENISHHKIVCGAGTCKTNDKDSNTREEILQRNLDKIEEISALYHEESQDKSKIVQRIETYVFKLEIT